MKEINMDQIQPRTLEDAKPFVNNIESVEDCSGGCDGCCSGSCGTSDSCQATPKK